VDKFVCQYLRIRPLEHIDVSSSLFSLHRSHISQAMAALIRSIGVDPEVAPQNYVPIAPAPPQPAPTTPRAPTAPSTPRVPITPAGPNSTPLAFGPQVAYHCITQNAVPPLDISGGRSQAFALFSAVPTIIQAGCCQIIPTDVCLFMGRGVMGELFTPPSLAIRSDVSVENPLIMPGYAGNAPGNVHVCLRNRSTIRAVHLSAGSMIANVVFTASPPTQMRVALDADVNWYKRVRPRAFDRAPPLQPQVMDVGPASVIPARNIPEDGSSRYSEVQGAQGPSFLHQPQSVVSASVVTTSQLREVRKPNKRGRPRTRGQIPPPPPPQLAPGLRPPLGGGVVGAQTSGPLSPPMGGVASSGGAQRGPPRKRRQNVAPSSSPHSANERASSESPPLVLFIDESEEGEGEEGEEEKTSNASDDVAPLDLSQK
jgi:dUTPase